MQHSPDRAPPLLVQAPAADGEPPLPPWAGPPPASLGLLELTLPLWARKGWLLAALLLGALAGFGLSTLQPLRFRAEASIVAQQVLRPSQGVVSGALPTLAGLVGAAGVNAVDLHLSLLRSDAMSDRILDRFGLQQAWGLPLRAQARQRLERRVSFGAGRRDGVVQIVVLDDSPHRAAAIANQHVVELRSMLQGFALEEARQRRKFFEAQLERARKQLAEAQQALQQSGVDRAALRAQPAAATERYARLASEVAAAEMRLAATRRVRTDASAEVRQQLAELAALRQQLAALQLPRDEDSGSYVARVREFRAAEALAESIARQAEAARVDEAGDAVPFQLLDQARPPEWPASPQPLWWTLLGGLGTLALAVAVVIWRHRQALARLDPAWQQRLALVQSVLPGARRRP